MCLVNLPNTEFHKKQLTGEILRYTDELDKVDNSDFAENIDRKCIWWLIAQC